MKFALGKNWLGFRVLRLLHPSLLEGSWLVMSGRRSVVGGCCKGPAEGRSMVAFWSVGRVIGGFHTFPAVEGSI